VTSIAVTSGASQVDNHDWLSSNFGLDEPRSITLDISAFTAAQHYPNGFIPAGMILARLTASPYLYVPYLDAGSGGASTAVGILAFTVPLVSPVVTTNDVGAAMMEMGIVIESKLPYTVGNAAAGGYIDANGKADLINWFKFL
jgi:hypothetical protein